MEQIGKFQLKKVLGKGASGTVYLALDTFSGKDIALKVLDPRLFSSPEFETSIAPQFLNEASLAGKLSHPHIASILEACVTSESGYIALEYVPGGNLSQYIAKDKLLSAENAIQVAFKSCGALDYAFRQGIVHRDVKPANIMVVSGTNIKIADFGAAYLKAGGHLSQLTQIGSPSYMSPEQIEGQELGHQSDMFSMGVVLYELFTGQKPFVGSTFEDLFKKIIGHTPPAPSALRRGLSPEVDLILLQMLAKAPAERYATWAELAMDIAKIGRLSVYEQEVCDSEKFTCFRRLPLLERLNDAEIWELVHAGSWTRVPAQQRIVREGDEGHTLFFIASGQAKATKQGRLLSVLSAGEYFGEMAYIKNPGIPRQATVESITDLMLAEFQPGALLKTSINCQLALANALMHSLVDRLALANDRLARAP